MNEAHMFNGKQHDQFTQFNMYELVISCKTINTNLLINSLLFTIVFKGKMSTDEVIPIILF